MRVELGAALLLAIAASAEAEAFGPNGVAVEPLATSVPWEACGHPVRELRVLTERGDIGWEASTTESWLELVGETSGIGDGVVRVRNANPGPLENGRMGIVTVAGIDVQVVEHLSCCMAAAPNFIVLPAEGSETFVSVFSPIGPRCFRTFYTLPDNPFRFLIDEISTPLPTGTYSVVSEPNRDPYPFSIAVRWSGATPEDILVRYFIQKIEQSGHSVLSLNPSGEAWAAPNDGGVLTGSGRWQAPTVRHDQTSGAQALAADFTGDGLLDLASIVGDGVARVVPNGGNFSFLPAQTMPAGGFVFDPFGGRVVLAGDFDGNGLADLCQVLPGEDSLFSRNLAGTLMPAVAQPGVVIDFDPVAGDWAGVGDFNGDSFDDLATVSASGTVGVHHGEAAGIAKREFRTHGTGFQWRVPEPGASRDGALPVVGDFNGDGRDDLACVLPQNNLLMMLSTADGFAPPLPWRAPGFRFAPERGDGWNVMSGDMDGDGLDDLVQLNEWGETWVAYSAGNALVPQTLKIGSSGFHHQPFGPWQTFVGAWTPQ